MKLMSEKPVTMTEVNELLEKRHKEAGEHFSYEQQNTLDYSAKFKERLTPAKSRDLRKELEEMGFLTDAQMISILDLLPKKEDVAKSILTGEKLEATEDQIKEVVKAVKKYAK